MVFFKPNKKCLAEEFKHFFLCDNIVYNVPYLKLELFCTYLKTDVERKPQRNTNSYQRHYPRQKVGCDQNKRPASIREQHNFKPYVYRPQTQF